MEMFDQYTPKSLIKQYIFLGRLLRMTLATFLQS